MRRAIMVVLVLRALLAESPARAICYGPSLMAANAGYVLPAQTERNYVITPSRPYWNVVAVQRQNGYGTDDYDIRMFKFSSGGVDPVCYSGELANSARSHGTDFVVGDFNYNPYGSYYPRMNCYSGNCDGAWVTWRDGNLLNVDASPITYPAALTVNDIVQVFDVYLLAGQKYFLNFQQSGEIPWKMLLFRNPANTTYWAGRNDAVIEADRCTTFVCPFTAYYGLVVVNDGSLGYGSGGFSLGVTTHNTCTCPERLVSGAGLTVPGPALDYRMAIQDAPHWNAVGVRSAGDWDVASWSLKRDLASIDCPDSLRGESAQVGNGTEVIVSDATSIPLPDTLAVTPATFFTSSPATVDYDAGTSVSNPAARMARTLGPQDVVEAWDILLWTGQATHFNLASYGPTARALLFRNPGSGRYEAGRAQAVLTVSDTATYVAQGDGFVDQYGLVLVHEDDTSGLATLEWGACPAPTPMGRTGSWDSFQRFASIAPVDTTWWVASVTGDVMDFDLKLYGAPNGPGYPECFSAPGAASQLSGTQTDFVVGDFHHMPLAPLYARFFQFDMSSPTDFGIGFTQWRQSGAALHVNAPAVADTLFLFPGLNGTGIHEIYLLAGVPYDIHFTPSPFGTEQAMLFGNAGGGTYFAPRSGAILSTNSVASFTPYYSGMYAIVVAGANSAGAITQLRVTSAVADVAPVLPARTALASLGPNPARGELRLGIELARSANVTLELFDVGGREIARRDLGAQPAGSSTQVWRLDGSESPAPGHYLLRMRADGVAVETRRVTLVR